MRTKVIRVEANFDAKATMLERQVRELLDDNARSMRSLHELNVGLAGLARSQRALSAAREEVEFRAIIDCRERAREDIDAIVAEIVSRRAAPKGRWARHRAARRTSQTERFIAKSPGFSAALYLAANPDVAAAGISPARHYVLHGWREMRRPHPLFDTKWYLRTYRDVLEAGAEPFEHYLRFGHREGRMPNRSFDCAWYLQANPDVAAAGLDPFVHYIQHGAAEGRWPHPLFDPVWYAHAYGVSDQNPWGALLHYLEEGEAAGNRANRYFDPVWYVRQNTGIRPLTDLLEHYYRSGGIEGLSPSLNFDSAAYLDVYLDVRQSGINPLAHFLHAGRSEGRVAIPATRKPSWNTFSVKLLYVQSDESTKEGDARMEHAIETLRRAGFDASAAQLTEIAENPDLLSRLDVLVLGDAGYATVSNLIGDCRTAGTAIAYDVGENSFEPEVANGQLAARLRDLSPREQQLHYERILSRRRLVMEADLIITATEASRAAAQWLGRSAVAVPTRIPYEMLGVAERARAGRVSNLEAGSVTIGYVSGSGTGGSGFSSVAPVLARLLRDNRNVRLTVIGALDPDDNASLSGLSDRITWRPMVARDQLPSEYARFDINVVPAVPGDPVGERQDVSRFIEASLVSVPTVAGATQPFRAEILDGSTGFLAETEADWERALTELIERPELRAQIGELARQDYLKVRRPRHDYLISEAFSRLRILNQVVVGAPAPSRPPLTRTARGRLKVGWVVPGLIIGGGGHRNIIRAAHYLQSFGHEVTLYFEYTDQSADTLRELVRTHFYPFTGRVRRFEGAEAGHDDVVFATHYSTVEPALRLTGPDAQTFYFVQDYEPAFFAMGSDYIIAENTYRKGLYAITSGPWCARILRRKYGMEADSFRFPIDRDIYFPRPGFQRRDRIVFFAKPEMERRCFEIGAAALARVKAARPDVEIVFFGSPKAAERVSYPVIHLEVVPTLEDLAELYASARLGLVFSTTNPSLVPYEMMACGLPVVDLDREDNAANYDDRRDIAYLADPRPEVMAEQILTLLQDKDDLERRSRNGERFTSLFPSELEMAKRVEDLILARLAALSRAA